jgi:hypothetical protein
LAQKRHHPLLKAKNRPQNSKNPKSVQNGIILVHFLNLPTLFPLLNLKNAYFFKNPVENKTAVAPPLKCD